MSADAIGWVFRHSALKGSAFQVHLAIADSVNDLHDNEFWMSMAKLATKARVERATASRAVKALVDAGLITLLEENSQAGKPSRYRFEFPDLEVAYEARGVSRQNTPGVCRENTGGCVERTQGGVSREHTNPKEQPKGNPTPTRSLSLAAVGGFLIFWEIYPRRVGKAAAQRAYESALKSIGPDYDAAARKVNAAAKNYRLYCERTERPNDKIAHPTTWLHQGRWDDELPGFEAKPPPGIELPDGRRQMTDDWGKPLVDAFGNPRLIEDEW